MAQAAPQVGEIIAGKYRVESVLGRGGMGVVFAARHNISERRVAVKWMEADPDGEADALERFVREARAMGRIEHPNVVGVLDVGTEGEVAYLVMDILRGESLRSFMTRENRLPADVALKTLLPAMEGVEAAHRAGVVHRDLKPENLFVVHSAGGEALTTKVLDFGISKLSESDSKKREARRLTKTGHVVGTPTYMAPEQVRGAAIDHRTDVWALATILYEMLAGRTPFDGDNYGALLVAIAVEPYEPLDPKLVPPDIARVVHKGLAKEPHDRWRSVLDFARALEPFAQGAKFAEPRRPSLAPAPDLQRSSGTPTRAVIGQRAPAPEAPTPELALPAARGIAQTVLRPGAPAPTPSRIARRFSDETTDSTRLAEASPNRRLYAMAALAFAVVVALVLVIRGIGNAARDAALLPDPALTQPIATRPTEPAAPTPTSVAPPTQAAGIDAPAAPIPSAVPVTTAPPPTSATHVRHETSPLRVHVGAATPPTTISVGTPPPTSTTPASRSGSISRDDF